MSTTPKHRGEEIEQAKLVKWSHKREVRALMPELAFLHHSPNGGERSAFAGAQMKALGVKRGFPDLVLPARRLAWIGLAVEMKSPIGRQSVEQVAWQDFLRAQGWVYSVARSAQEGRETICRYLDIDPDSAPLLD